MDENENLPDLTVDENEEIPEFTLEDILAEFGSGSADRDDTFVPAEPEPDAPVLLTYEEYCQGIKDSLSPAELEEPTDARYPWEGITPGEWERLKEGPRRTAEEWAAGGLKGVLPEPDAPVLLTYEEYCQGIMDRLSPEERENPTDARYPWKGITPEEWERLKEGPRRTAEEWAAGGLKDALPEPEEDCKVYEPGSPAPTAPAVTGDTIVMDTGKITAEAERQKQAVASGDTVRFTPVGQESPVTHAPEDNGTEPFSENWEPVYDEPIGEYSPPEPIVFRPKSRLQELKRKIEEGPEKRYYALLEKGVGKLQVAIFFSMLVVILAVASIVLDHLGLVREDRMRMLVFGEVFAMLVSGLLAANRMGSGLNDLFHGRFTLDTLLVVSFAACILDAVFCLKEVRVPFCGAFCLEVFMALWSQYQRRTTEISQMDTLRRAVRLNRVEKAPDCYEGRPGFHVTDGEVEDFMDNYDQPSAPRKQLDFYALLATVAATVIGIYAGIQGDAASGVQVWAAAILAAAPVTIFISQSRPAAILERRLSRFGAVVCGWKGVDAMSGQAVVPLRDTDLFPGGSVKINGVKFYSNRDADHIVSCAAALMEASGNGLSPLFEQLRESRNSPVCVCSESRIYGTRGVGGIIEGESVLMGTKAFLKDMGVDVPDGAHVSQAVYLAVEGEFCAVFALAYGKLKGVSASLQALSNYRGLTPVLASGNFLLSEEFIRAKFGVNTNRFAFPGEEARRNLAGWQPAPDTTVPCALTTQEGLTGIAFSITGARSLRSSARTGAVVHILGGIVGLLAVLALTVVGAWDLLTPANLLLFELIWTVPGLLISSWTRRL